jgi:hypothetical protein
MGKDCNLPKPGPKFRIEYRAGEHRGWYVLDPDGLPCAGPFNDRNKAGMSRDARQAEADARAKRGERPCLCCGRTFQSEGIHNRMCDLCRHRDFAPDPFSSGFRRSEKAA